MIALFGLGFAAAKPPNTERAAATATMPSAPVDTTQNNNENKNRDEKKNDLMFDIECAQSTINNGAFSLKRCTIVQTSGDVGEAVKTNQHVQSITLHGVNPSGTANAKDIAFKDIQLQIFPFGRVQSVPIHNVDKVDESKESNENK